MQGGPRYKALDSASDGSVQGIPQVQMMPLLDASEGKIWAFLSRNTLNVWIRGKYDGSALLSHLMEDPREDLVYSKCDFWNE